MITKEQYQILSGLMLKNPERLSVFSSVRSLELPDCWIGAGFVRNAVWDHLHNIHTDINAYDIDVIYFDPKNLSPEADLLLEEKLKTLAPKHIWSVKNQARMHERNQDEAYTSCLDAISKWPETATSVAARITPQGALEVIAPYGVEDIFQLVVRPTPHFLKKNKQGIVVERIEKHRWLMRWPNLQVVL